MVCIASRAASLAPHFPLVASPMSVRGFQCRIVILAQGSANWGRRSRRDFALAERMATGEFAHREAQLDAASCTGSITQDPAIVAMHGGRRESTKGTASCGMRCNDSNDQTGFGESLSDQSASLREVEARGSFPSPPRISRQRGVYKLLLEGTLSRRGNLLLETSRRYAPNRAMRHIDR